MGDVIDFSSRFRSRHDKLVSTNERVEEATQPALSNTDFQNIAQKNASVQEKLRKERAQANQNVLKSYRIK